MEDILLPASPKLAESLPEQVTQVVVGISIPVQKNQLRFKIYVHKKNIWIIFG